MNKITEEEKEYNCCELIFDDIFNEINNFINNLNYKMRFLKRNGNTLEINCRVDEILELYKDIAYLYTSSKESYHNRVINNSEIKDCSSSSLRREMEELYYNNSVISDRVLIINGLFGQISIIILNLDYRIKLIKQTKKPLEIKHRINEVSSLKKHLKLLFELLVEKNKKMASKDE